MDTGSVTFSSDGNRELIIEVQKGKLMFRTERITKVAY